MSVPINISVSSLSDSRIQFLSPIVNEPSTVEFCLTVSDGQIIQTKSIPVEILPYKPELKTAEISKIEAIDSLFPNYSQNVIDGTMETM